MSGSRSSPRRRSSSPATAPSCPPSRGSSPRSSSSTSSPTSSPCTGQQGHRPSHEHGGSEAATLPERGLHAGVLAPHHGPQAHRDPLPALGADLLHAGGGVRRPHA